MMKFNYFAISYMKKYLLSLILFFFASNEPFANNEKKPNFLFILVDDQPFDAVGFSGR